MTGERTGGVEGCQVGLGKGDAACTLAVLVRTSAQHLHLRCYEGLQWQVGEGGGGPGLAGGAEGRQAQQRCRGWVRERGEHGAEVGRAGQ